MKKFKKTSDFQPSIALFLTILLIFQVIMYVFIYQFQEFTMTMFFLGLLIPVGSFIGFFFGLIPSMMYSVGIVITLSILAVLQPFIVSTFMFVTAGMAMFTTMVAAFAHSSYQNDQEELETLSEEKYTYQVIDPITKLETEQVLIDLLMKQAYLAHRYDQYSFSVVQVRLDFIQTTKGILGKQEYADLLSRISIVLQSAIRLEDYKFSISEGVFVLLLPFTDKANFSIIDERIKSQIMEIELLDRNHKLFVPTIRSGVIMYEDEKFNDFQNWDVLSLQLQRQTEIDIQAEY
ncbi:MAG: diguanylate cyclase domain-containing protein [Culicoidibacterales bacterium]